MIIRDDGTPDFHALRSQHRGHEAVLVAFDLIERDGEDLRDLPLIERKRRLGRLIGKTKNRRAIQYGEHLKVTARPCLTTPAGWGWKASSQSGWTRRIAAAHPRRGSSRKTRPWSERASACRCG